MLHEITKTLQKGLDAMRSNSKIFLVGILIFVFPLLFFSLTQSFFTTAYDNIQTADSKRLGTIHKSVFLIIQHEIDQPETVNQLLQEIVNDNSQDLISLRIISDIDSHKILNASDESLIGTEHVFNKHVMNTGFTDERNFNRFDFLYEGHRIWQAYSKINFDGKNYYIFSEQDFSVIDGIMSARQNQAYFGLTAIFIFLIALAYWINKQTSWQVETDKLQRELKERGFFSNMIAHEFRTPLTAVKGYASFLEQSKNLSKDEVRFVNNISSSAERLIFLVNDFLEVSRLQSGNLKTQRESVNILTLLQKVADDLLPLAIDNGVAINVDNVPKKLSIMSDEKRLLQILTNLVTNSIKYTKQGTVTLSCDYTHDKISIFIKDTGVGISSEDQKNLFTPFKRFGDADESNIVGSGLGMWISSQLISILGGKIGVESIKGIGTHTILTFSINK